MEWLTWLDNHAGSVGALATLALVAITGFYAWSAYRLVHSPYEARLVPVWLKWEVSNTELHVKNYGPGSALGVRYSAVVARDGLLVGRVVSTPPLDEVPIGTRSAMGLKGTLLADHSILVTWQTVSGKRRKGYWTAVDGGTPARLSRRARAWRELRRLPNRKQFPRPEG